VTRQLVGQAVTVKTGTLVDGTVIGSASKQEKEAAWSGHRTRKAVHGYIAHVGADAETAMVKEVSITPGNLHDGQQGVVPCPIIPAMSLPIAATAGSIFHLPILPRAALPLLSRQAPGGGPAMIVLNVCDAGTLAFIKSAVGSKRYSERGSDPTDCDACDGEDW
jgi:IS5 family transposase